MHAPIRLLDIAERVLLALLFAYMVFTFSRQWAEDGNIVSAVVVVSEASVLVFVLCRRFTNELSLRPLDWALAFFGSMLPMLVQPPSGNNLLPMSVCGLIMLAGLVIQLSAKLTLRRSFGVVAANRGVKIGGPYRVVRHPMYAGYLLTHIGFLLASPSLANALIYLVCQACQVGRILAEERLLSEDGKYRAFAAAVRYRLVPGIF